MYLVLMHVNSCVGFRLQSAAKHYLMVLSLVSIVVISWELTVSVVVPNKHNELLAMTAEPDAAYLKHE